MEEENLNFLIQFCWIFIAVTNAQTICFLSNNSNARYLYYCLKYKSKLIIISPHKECDMNLWFPNQKSVVIADTILQIQKETT